MRRLEQSSRLARYVWRHPEVRGQRARALARVAAWQCWERVTKRPWTVALRGDVRLRCYPHSTAASGVIYVRYPEWRDMRFLVDFLRPGDVFADVGANVGVYSLLACTVSRVVVWAFEPSSASFSRASENVRINGLEDRVHLVQAAAGARAGSALLTVGLDTVNRLDDTNGCATERVQVIELGPFLANAAVDLTNLSVIKVDVEGFEREVLAGAESLLDAAAPVLIVERNKPDELRALLSPKGYVPFDYDPLTRAVTAASWSDGTKSPNLLLCKGLESIQLRLASGVMTG